MTGYFVQNEIQCKKLLNELIPKGATVGSGDSVTLEQTGIISFLEQGDYIFNKKSKELTAQRKREIYLKNFSADVFVTGTNAVTIDGKLFNIDDNGSRVAPILYGPKKVIIVVGVNKIVQNTKEAIQRTRQVAALLDAKRLEKNTPCVTLKKCVDCRHEQRICNDFVLITGQFDKDRIYLIIVKQVLGY